MMLKTKIEELTTHMNDMNLKTTSGDLMKNQIKNNV